MKSYAAIGSLVIGLVCHVGILSGAGDWLQFRGADGRSVVADGTARTEWSLDQKLAWRVKLPGRAVNGVIVVQGNVIATSSSGLAQDRLHVWSIDEQSGQVAWRRTFYATGRTACHPLSAVAAATPASDGQSIYALFSSNDLVCLDLAGNVRWIRSLEREFPSAFDDRGLASSPLVVKGTVVLQIACQGDSIALGIDADTGANRWKRELSRATAWSSPTAMRVGDGDLALIQSADALMAIEPVSGELVWSLKQQGNLIPSLAVDGKTIFLPAAGLTAWQLEHGTAEPSQVWSEPRLAPGSSSPVAHDGKVYIIRGPNVLTCGTANEGKSSWQLRLKGTRIWATPLLIGQQLYVVNDAGLVQVVDVSTDPPKLVAENDFAEEMLGSPAYANGALFWRGVSHVFKVSAPTES